MAQGSNAICMLNQVWSTKLKTSKVLSWRKILKNEAKICTKSQKNCELRANTPDSSPLEPRPFDVVNPDAPDIWRPYLWFLLNIDAGFLTPMWPLSSNAICMLNQVWSTKLKTSKVLSWWKVPVEDRHDEVWGMRKSLWSLSVRPECAGHYCFTT